MDLSRQEYPALLVGLRPVPPPPNIPTDVRYLLCQQASLQPNQATTVLNDRVRLINKVNADIADWLQVLKGSLPLHRQCIALHELR